MEQIAPSAKWTVIQPWRGFFGLVVTICVALIITSAFSMESFLGLFTLLALSFIPIEIVIGLGWGGKFPITEGWPQPWPGFFLTLFTVLVGTLACFATLTLIGGGATHPYVSAYAIVVVITMFFMVVVFGMWPFQKLSLPTKGFLCWICAYVIAFIIIQLFDFTWLSFPAGANPSPVAPVPFYGPGGPLAVFWAPAGAFRWEAALAFYIWMVPSLWAFVTLGMWPFSRSPKLMRQPLLGVLVTACCVLVAVIAHYVFIIGFSVEPLRHLLNGVCYLFGILMFLTMFQMWPGRLLNQPLGGFVNIVLAIGVAILGYYFVTAFCQCHFGKAFAYPASYFSVATVMLSLMFPLWAAYGGFWDFWPLPPTPTQSDAA
ncbi:MAG: hypothetical protein ABSC55_23325 [Syntrophorhabdales bacterium]|jgi:hypothetical protein